MADTIQKIFTDESLATLVSETKAYTDNAIPSVATQSKDGLMSSEDKSQLDYGGIPIVTTAGTGAAYTATVTGMDSLKVGAKITIIPHTVSTEYAPTLNVNSLGAKAIRMPVSYNTSTTSNGVLTSWLVANKPVTVQYNGSYWLTIDLVRPSAQYLYGTVPVENGGTGAATASAACANIGALPTSGGTMTGAIKASVDGTDQSVITAYDSTNKIVAFGYGMQSLGSNYSVRYCGGKTYIDSAEAIRLRPYDNYYGSLIFGSTSGQLEFRTNQDGYGNVGAASYRFKNVYSTNGVSTTSDERLKEKVSDDFTALSKVFTELRPVTFEYADIKDGKIRFGFIAQEVEATLSKYGYDPDKFALLTKTKIEPDSDMAKFIGDTIIYSLNYDEFSPWAIAILQMQGKKIDSLEEEVFNLKQGITEIKNIIESK